MSAESSAQASPAISLICEIEPATRPSFDRVKDQVQALRSVSSSFLVPDNHLGRATLSSIATAHEVRSFGAHAIACLNSRDRNALGFERDLLTAAGLGIHDLLLVFGDRPKAGSRGNDLNVAKMLERTRAFSERFSLDVPAFRAAVTTRLSTVPEWKRSADSLFVQAGFDIEQLLSWRATTDFPGEVYAGVLVLSSIQMLKRLQQSTSEIAVPSDLEARIEKEPLAGVEVAVEQIQAIAASGSFDGIHLIPIGRYREVVARLEEIDLPLRHPDGLSEETVLADVRN